MSLIKILAATYLGTWEINMNLLFIINNSLPVITKCKRSSSRIIMTSFFPLLPIFVTLENRAVHVETGTKVLDLIVRVLY